jgi:hypothetical protein
MLNASISVDDPERTLAGQQRVNRPAWRASSDVSNTSSASIFRV